MIVWTGLGYLVLLITFGCLLVTQVLVDKALDDESYYTTHGWPKLVGFLVAALLLHLFAKVRARGEGRVLVDIETGEHVSTGSRDSLFFIPLRFWPAIVSVLGVVFLFVPEDV